MIFLMPSFFASQSAHFGQGWGTILILRQHIFGIFQAHPLHCRFLVPGYTQKILTEIWHHFWLKMMVKSGFEKTFLKFNGGLHRYLLTCQANSSFLGRFFCTGQQQHQRPSWNFKIIFSRPLFTIIFKLKMVSNLRKNFLFIVWHQKPILSLHE